MELFAVFVLIIWVSPISLAMEADVFEGAESIVLPCQFFGLIPEENPTVIWRRYDLKPQIVHLRREDDDLRGQNQRFSGRTSVKPDALDSGDFSLSLRKPHLSDSGVYTCSISDGKDEITVTEVQLQVKVQQVEVKVEEGVDFAKLPCKTTADLEEDATVEWIRSEPEFMMVHVYQNGSNKVKEQDKGYCERTRMHKELVKTGDLSLTLGYPTQRDNGVYICTIYRKGDIVRQKVVLHCVKEKFPSQAKGFLVFLIFLVVVGGLLFHFRQYLQSVYKMEVDSGVESAKLPCKAIVHLPKDVTVTWRNNTNCIVHMYQGSCNKLEEQHRLYKNRTEMKEILKHGDFSLILRNPTVRDTDTYTCIVSNRWGKTLINKQVLLNVRAGPDSLIVAIDIGSGYSGYAFNVKPSGEGSEAQLKRWGKEFGLDTPKTPTCILFDEHEKFLKFGYEAKTVYINMKGEAAEKYYFFENFKTTLKCRILKNQTIKAANGKSMKALKVFTEVLQCLKDDALKAIMAHATGGKVTASDFIWVLTVPALWGNPAKQFMREAATQAGIITDGTKGKLLFALESEAALAWCLKLPSDGFITQNQRDSGSITVQSSAPRESNISSKDPPVSHLAEDTVLKGEETRDLLKKQHKNGNCYVVVDCGDETIDITVYKVLEGGAWKKMYEAPENHVGGQSVDRKMKQFLREIFSDGVWEEYEQKFPSQVQIIMYEFTRLKQVDEDVSIMCPNNLGMLAQKKKEIKLFFDAVEGASWEDGYINISRDKLRSFFDDYVYRTTESLREILRREFKFGFILLVGGFAGSQILIQHITDSFGHQCKVLCPHRPQEAIMKGAIELGRNPKLMASQKKYPACLKDFL